MENQTVCEGEISVGPWGATKGEHWSFKAKPGIKQIIITHGQYVNTLMFKDYSDDANPAKYSSAFGVSGGCHTNKIDIDFPSEFLTGITMTYFYEEFNDVAADHGICKRKADPNYALDNTPDTKRILQASECMNEEEEDWFVDGYCAPQDNRDRLDDFFNNERFIEILADKVINNTQLKLMIAELMDTLREACAYGALESFTSKLRDLIHYPDFIQACLDTYLEDDGHKLITLIGIYSSEKQPNERLEKLRADHHLDSLLKETESIRITRVVLSVLFGYWNDYAFNENVYRAISSHRNKNKPPPPTGPTFTRSETVVGIDYPASVEGLKEVFVTRYPVDEAKIICEEIDRLAYIPEFFKPDECRRIKWLMFTLSKNKLVVHTVGFSDYEGGIW